jgi:hypothetical protein
MNYLLATGLDHARQNRNLRHGILENHAYANHVSFESTASATHSSPHHRLASGPPSSVSAIDPSVAYSSQIPNFAPQSLYQNPQQMTPPQHVQMPQHEQHFTPALQTLQVADMHPNTSTHVEPTVQVQNPQNQVHNQNQHVDEQTSQSQTARIDAEAARILHAQQQMASMSQGQHNPPQLQPNSSHYTPSDVRSLFKF